MTLVKICGLTNLDDALVALEAGADYLGFIFYEKSPRAVTLAGIAPILRAIRERDKPPICVGVFVNPTEDQVIQALSGKGLADDCATVDYCQINKPDQAMVKALRTKTNNHIFVALQPQSKDDVISAVMDYHAMEDERRSELPQVLIDAYHPTLSGGTGQRTDLSIVTDLPPILKRVMLAGGLNPDNVGEAIRAVRPWAVDVASGVEASPGKKDHGKVRAFIQAVREADKM